MRFYCGIDLHAKDCFLCVIDDQDKIHLKSKVPNHLPGILDRLEAFPSRPSVVVESTLNWYWLVDGLEGAGFEVKLAHTLGLYMITGAKVKTDRRDAFTLARLLRLGAIPEAYIYPKDSRPIRDLLRRRNRLVSVRGSGYAALSRALLQHGIFGYSQDQIKHFGEEQISEHFDHLADQCHCLLELERIRLYTRQIKILEELILGTVVDQPLFDLLQTIPGVGKILGLTIFYEVGDIGRFQSPKHFCSYARVVPGIAQSANVSKRARGSKQGNPHLKWAFCQAAVQATRYHRVTPISNGPSARQQSRPPDITALSENSGKSI
jgi:transposase